MPDTDTSPRAAHVLNKAKQLLDLLEAERGALEPDAHPYMVQDVVEDLVHVLVALQERVDELKAALARATQQATEHQHQMRADAHAAVAAAADLGVHEYSDGAGYAYLDSGRKHTPEAVTNALWILGWVPRVWAVIEGQCTIAVVRK